jgi:hypothetical protein
MNCDDAIVNFKNTNFLPIESQVVRTANFLQKFVASENSLCSLFNKIAKHQLNLLFTQYGKHVKSAHQLSVGINNLFLPLTKVDCPYELFCGGSFLLKFLLIFLFHAVLIDELS